MQVYEIPATRTNVTSNSENFPRNIPQVAVIVLNWNAWDLTEQTLDSIECLRYRKLDVILVDNGSSCPVPPEYKKKFPNLIFVQTGANLGYTGGNNLGIKVALQRNANYVLILNNDVLIKDPDLLSKLVSAARHSPSAGIFAPQVIQYNHDGKRIRDRYQGRAQMLISQLKSINTSSNPRPKSDDFLDRPHAPRLHTNVTNLSHVCGCAMFISRDFLERVGLFDERLFMYDDEYDLCLRGTDAGFLIQQVNNTFVSRLNVCTQSNMPSYRTYLYGRNRFLLAKKRPSSLHSIVFLFLHSISSLRLAFTLLRHGRSQEFTSLISGICDGIRSRWGITPALRTLLKQS